MAKLILDKYVGTDKNMRSGVERRRANPPPYHGMERRRAAELRGGKGVESKFQLPGSISKMFRKTLSAFGRNSESTIDDDIRYTPSATKPVRTSTSERAFDRIERQAPVLIEDYDTHTVKPATMLNYSKTGMYIESELAPMVNSGIVIQMVDHSPGASEPEDLEKYFAQVKWRRKVSGMVVFSRYGIGVEYCSNIDDYLTLFSN